VSDFTVNWQIFEESQYLDEVDIDIRTRQGKSSEATGAAALRFEPTRENREVSFA